VVGRLAQRESRKDGRRAGELVQEPGKNTRSVEALIPERWIRIAPQ
jgi:hypothetical protein